MASILINLFGIVLVAVGICANEAVALNFDQNYYALWGLNHFNLLNQGREVQLLLDQSSGSGFRSKFEYGSGLFRIRMKTPDKKTAGVVTTFYLTSAPDKNQGPGLHDELDFEFVDTNGTLQTNVFANDEGNREQTFKLWFDPSKDFHTYEILWNQHQIVFSVDKIPIRVFNNNTRVGVNYPSKPMHIEASIWNGSWAGNVDWVQAPFIAHYQEFNLDGCPSNLQHCNSSEYWWNTNKFWKLNSNQKKAYKAVRTRFMSYDYCSDRRRYPTSPPECAFNN